MKATQTLWCDENGVGGRKYITKFSIARLYVKNISLVRFAGVAIRYEFRIRMELSQPRKIGQLFAMLSTYTA